jgi:hypothetical protein
MDTHDLRTRYFALADDIQQGLQAQLGDALRLNPLRDQILAFRVEMAGSPVSEVINPPLAYI